MVSRSSLPLSEQTAVGQSRSLREQAYEELKRLILESELADVPFLSARALAKRMNMSITPVRSAVERLEAEGFLSIGAQRGISLNELTPQEIVDHYELRQAVEVLVLKKIAGRLNSNQIGQLRANVANYAASLAAGDIPRYIALDGEFHLLLAAFAGNQDIERVLQQLRDRIHRVILRVIEYLPTRMQASIDEHSQLVDSIEAGDAARAADIMTNHLRGGLKVLVPSAPDDVFAPTRRE